MSEYSRYSYVISEELDLDRPDLEELIRPERLMYFRSNLDAGLRYMGKETLWIPSNVMRRGINKSIDRTNLPVVSLDDRYATNADDYIGISRGVDENLEDSGYVPRVNYPPISEQMARIAGLSNEIIIADDVLFSGEMITWLANELKTYGVKIGGVICGLAIQEGLDRMMSEGIDLEAAIYLDGVEEEICERDFAIVPGSGRRIDGLGRNALYFDPVYGRPEKWASIPSDKAFKFARCQYLNASNLLNIRPGMQVGDIGDFLGWASTDSAGALGASKTWLESTDASRSRNYEWDDWDGLVY